MNKARLLYTIDAFDHADAVEIAEALELNYSSVAMGLLRLVRQGLATRYIDPDTQLLVYEITPKGEARIDYFLEGEFDDE
jgi:DNA-binding MarR family transcriptional regulator